MEAGEKINVRLTKKVAELTADDLLEFDWICREEESHTRKLTAEVFEEIGVQCNNFNVMSIMQSPTAIKESILNNIPLRRYGKPEEVAYLVAFLVSDLNTYITGQTILIDGGLY
jgi:NAD(P)-dependent dehydrogenase (short-subunit alcohol dehydrogenase family)